MHAPLHIHALGDGYNLSYKLCPSHLIADGCMMLMVAAGFCCCLLGIPVLSAYGHDCVKQRACVNDFQLPCNVLCIWLCVPESIRLRLQPRTGSEQDDHVTTLHQSCPDPLSRLCLMPFTATDTCWTTFAPTLLSLRMGTAQTTMCHRALSSAPHCCSSTCPQRCQTSWQ